MAGLNPHAGENGLFGDEEINEIRPAVEWAQSQGMPVEGPLPPDTLFYMAVRKKKYDAIVCMYHDQGHVPLKLLDFEGGVNVALGLPIIRTSVDHGTAFDIAGTGVASTQEPAESARFCRTAGAQQSNACLTGLLDCNHLMDLVCRDRDLRSTSLRLWIAGLAALAFAKPPLTRIRATYSIGSSITGGKTCRPLSKRSAGRGGGAAKLTR